MTTPDTLEENAPRTSGLLREEIAGLRRDLRNKRNFDWGLLVAILTLIVTVVGAIFAWHAIDVAWKIEKTQELTARQISRPAVANIGDFVVLKLPKSGCTDTAFTAISNQGGSTTSLVGARRSTSESKQVQVAYLDPTTGVIVKDGPVSIAPGNFVLAMVDDTGIACQEASGVGQVRMVAPLFDFSDGETLQYPGKTPKKYDIENFRAELESFSAACKGEVASCPNKLP